MTKEYLIGDFLKRIKRPIQLYNEKQYKLITIRINHNGIVLREKKMGYEIKSKMFQVKRGDFILSGIDARNGAFGIIPDELDKGVVTNDFWYFEIDESIINKHLFLELTATNWFDEICKRGSDGTTQRIRLQKDKFFNQKVYLPGIHEQEKLLSKLIELKENQSELNRQIKTQKKLLTQLKQSILQEAIQGKLTTTWRTQNPDVEPASELLKRIKAEKEKLIEAKKIKKEKPLPPISQEEIPFELPEGWIWCKLRVLCSKTGSGSTPRGGKAIYLDKGVKFIRSQNVYNGGLILSEIAYISEKTHEKMSNTKVQSEDLLLNITGGSIGRCCIVSKDFDTGNINQHVSIIRTLFSELNYYLHKVICSPYFQDEIINAQTGAGREGLPKNKMDNILIPMPSEQEQKVIVQKVDALLQKCQALEAEIAQSEEHAQMLMQAVLKEAFEGKGGENKI